MGLETKVWNDWKLFYRSSMPEKTSTRTYSARIQRKIRAMGGYALQLLETTLHKNKAAMAAISDRRAAKRKATKL